MIETSTLISIVSVGIAVIVGLTGMKRDRTTDDRKGATEMATVIVKLENIGKDTSEIKNEIKSVKEDLQMLRERVVKTEQTCKALHKRVDAFEVKLEHLSEKE